MHVPSNVVQLLMQRAPSFDDFLAMRLVCKQWAAVSRDMVDWWYFWLCAYGPRARPVPHDDQKFPYCEKPCKRPYHRVVAGPKVLKTMPLCDQVFRLGAERAEKHLGKLVHTYEFEVRIARERLLAKEVGLEAHRAAYVAHAVCAERLLTRLANRKRRRISKPAELSLQ